MLLSLRRWAVLETDLLKLPRLIAARLAEIRHAAEGRRAIARMDARMLSDIGLSPSEAAREINRQPWDTAPRPHRDR